MKHITRAICALLILCLAMTAACAEEPARTLTVTGSAAVTVPADMAIVRLGVETNAKDVTTAMAENAERIQAVIEALKNAGIAEEDIVTERFYISTLYDYSSYSSLTGTEGRIKGYSVTNGLSVTVREITKAGSIIDTAFQAGANQCNGIEAATSSAGEAADRALAKAIAEGKRRAELMAAAAGKTVGELLSISDSGYVSSRAVYTYDEAAKNSAMGTQIIADGLDYSATVTMVFELK